MGPQLTISFSGTSEEEDLALLPEAITGDLRQGSTSGTAEEYSWKLT